MNTNNTTDANATPTLVLMMGGPGSGKSYVARRDYAELSVVNADAIKATHPDYDPNNPAALSAIHEWSSQEATRALFTALGSGESVLFDGTGNTAEKYVGFANTAHAAGYTVELCYVATSLSTALARNAQRERTVDPTVVRQRHASVATNVDIVARYVDSVRVVNN